VSGILQKAVLTVKKSAREVVHQADFGVSGRKGRDDPAQVKHFYDAPTMG
jgi:hypothetical protein